MAWFEWASTKEKKSTIKNMVAVMKADGKVTDNEMRCLRAACERIELSDDDLQAIINAPDSTRFVVPRKDKEKVRQLIDIIAMMLADGETNEKERNIFFTICKAFGFSRELAEELHEEAVESIINGESEEHACDKLESLLDFP